MTAVALAQTATDHTDFLNKVYLFMTTNTDLITAGEEWVTDRYVAGDEFIIHSPQAGDLQDIYIGWRVIEDVSNNIYNIEIRGFGGYVSGFTWDNQPVAQPKSVYLCSIDEALTYWIVASHRRFVVIEKVSTVYLSAYCGLFVPYATPTQYPYPMYVGASSGEMVRFSATSAISHAARPVGANDTTTSGYIYDNGGWHTVRCSTDNGTSVQGTVTLHPFHYTSHRLLGSTDVDATVTVEDTLVLNYVNSALAGILEGIGWVSGYDSQTSESTVSFDGDTWIIIQDVYRLAVNNFYAVRLI